MDEFDFFIERLFSGIGAEPYNKVNYVVNKMPDSEKEALYEYIKYFFSQTEGYDVQRLSLNAFPSADAFINKISELSQNSPKGLLMIEDINTPDIELFNIFRYYLKEPKSSRFPAGWLILSLWDEKSIDLLDEGLKCSISVWSYINYIKNGGKSIASQLLSVKNPESSD